MQLLFKLGLALSLNLTSFLQNQLPVTHQTQSVATTPTCQQKAPATNFLVVGGGGRPSYNEIAIEKNVLYFQRTLKLLGFDPAKAAIYFANGNDGQATIRYMENGRERYKAPEIPQLDGAATLANLQRWMQQAPKQKGRPIFFYFTGHGGENRRNLENNSMILWGEKYLSVQQFAQMLDRLPPQSPVVTMMAQCYSGSFANFIYQKGDPNRPVALQTRCGFFATVKELPSVGCTPEVNEADYRDYSSSFFAGLSGRNRVGQPVASADYNRDGRVSFSEAHAFAKVDEQTIDLPISTSEAWLRKRISKQTDRSTQTQSIASILQSARPEQRYVVESLMQRFSFRATDSFETNLYRMSESQLSNDVQQAYMKRLWLELLNINTEKQVRASKNRKELPVLDRLLKCESGSWAK
jgi:hypothetical protein